MQARDADSMWATALRVVHQLVFGEDVESGAAIVEFTIIAPMLVVMSIYAADFGLFFFNKMEMQNAAQAGAQWAIANHVFNLSDIQTAGANATSLPASAITIAASPFCACSKDSSQNPVVTSVATTPCTPNSTCNTSGVLGTYVTVTATPTTTYQSFVHYGLFLNNKSISATATVRTQ
jgi:Flp pilus assembly protein TadG